MVDLYAQVPEKNVTVQDTLLGKKITPVDTTDNKDSLTTVPQGNPLPKTDTTKADSTVMAAPRSDVETTIDYSARDSIKFSVKTKVVRLYGDAKIVYGQIELEANQITIDYNKNTLTAHGKIDSLGNKIGFPIFKNGSEVYETKDITYNFKTGRARISEVVTQQGEGYLHGEIVYKNEQNELFSIDNTYTTCNLADPHYRIRARRTKAIPDDKIVAGPFNLEINDVPTPLGFPFGMFPAKNEASSGILVPSYGEERRRGFFLRGGGYFFDINDYVTAAIRGDIYSKGSYGLDLSVPYRKRYAFNGNFSFNFTQLRISDRIEDADEKQNDFRLNWSHSPQTKGTGRFSASVNAATSSYNRNNFLPNANDSRATGNQINNFSRKLSSNISYSKTFPNSPFSLGVSARHNQDVRNKQVDLLLPSVSFNMSNIYPLRGKSGGNTWKDKITLRYTMQGSNDITNNLGRIGDATQDSIAPFTFDNFSTFLANSRKGFSHQVPLSTSFKVLKYFTASPSVNYDEKWYFEKLEWAIDPENPNQAIIADTLDGFNRVYTYNTSISLNTRLYGTHIFKNGGKIEAIRHVMNPRVSFSYRPDFSDEKFGYFQRLTTEDGEEILRSRYQGAIFGGPSIGESGNIGLSIDNTLEMKVRSEDDSVKQSKKIPILNNFGLNTGYNIVADSFKLSDIR
ncbi:MAG: putative LPS assembly protein LptD, partial [Fulvivirga sp.]|nr:putative LPS assembly protein LptD [Fulvivirga sp.]